MHWSDGNLHALNRHLADLENTVGTEEGEVCGAYSEPDEDCPVSKQCDGILVADEDGEIACDYCGRTTP